jgi:hypothetical protein
MSLRISRHFDFVKLRQQSQKANDGAATEVSAGRGDGGKAEGSRGAKT